LIRDPHFGADGFDGDGVCDGVTDDDAAGTTAAGLDGEALGLGSFDGTGLDDELALGTGEPEADGDALGNIELDALATGDADGVVDGTADEDAVGSLEVDADGSTEVEALALGTEDGEAVVLWLGMADADGLDDGRGDCDELSLAAADADGLAVGDGVTVAGDDALGELEAAGDDDGTGDFVGVTEREAADPPLHCMDSTKEPCTVLNPSTTTIKFPDPVKPVNTALFSFDAQVPQLSQTVSCCIIPSVYTRNTVSMALPQVLNV
jgi:hypothetical protein